MIQEKLKAASMFIAVKGEKFDGHNFIQQSIDKGAAVIVCEDLPAELKDNITYIQVKNAHEAVHTSHIIFMMSLHKN